MLNLTKGRNIAKIEGGQFNNKIVKINTESKDGADEINLNEESKFMPMLENGDRNIFYIAGPSGSGKSTMAAKILKEYGKHKMIFIFSRTNYKNDPALKDLNLIQIKVDEKIIEENPIDVEKDFKQNSVLFFDDITTFQNKNVKEYVTNIMCDALEIGRKLKIHLIITNHLLIPNEKKLARTIMNETHNVIFFPKSGQIHQINYCLQTYLGLKKKQINDILELDSRWISICKLYPLCLISEKSVYLL